MAPPTKVRARPSKSPLHKRLDNIRNYLDLRDTKRNYMHFSDPLTLQPAMTTVPICINLQMHKAYGYKRPPGQFTNPRGKPIKVDCKAIAQKLEKLIKIDKKVKGFAFVKWYLAKQIGSRQRIKRRPKKPKLDELYADLILRNMIRGILLGHLSPSLSLNQMIDKMDQINSAIFAHWSTLTQRFAKKLKYRSTSIVIIDAVDARKLFTRVLKRYSLTNKSPSTKQKPSKKLATPKSTRQK